MRLACCVLHVLCQVHDSVLRAVMLRCGSALLYAVEDIDPLLDDQPDLHLTEEVAAASPASASVSASASVFLRF